MTSLPEVLFNRIHGTKGRRESDRKLAFQGHPHPDPPLGHGCFQPLIFGIWGEFDLAAVYFSPSLTQITPAGRMLELGQSVHVCMLPKPVADDLDDLNLAYFQSCSMASVEPPKPLRESLRFVTVIRVKVAPYAAWQCPGEIPRTEFLATLREIWACVAAWREGGAAKHLDYHAAIGLTLEWTEVAIVAHAVTPHALLDLTFRLRAVTKTVHGTDKEAHICLSTFTAVGFDASIDMHASELFERETKHKQDGDRGLGFDDLVRLAGACSQGYGETAVDAGNTLPPATLRTHFVVHPGHEQPFAKFWTEFPESSLAEPHPPFATGSRDLSMPPLRLRRPGDPEKPGYYTPVEAATLSCLFRHRLMMERKGIRNYYRAVSTLAVHRNPDEYAAISAHHVSGDPREDFKTEGLPRAVEDHLNLRDSLRRLQVSYSQTEQLGNILTTFKSAWNSLLLWESALEIASAMLALAAHVRAVEAWLRSGGSAGSGDSTHTPLQRLAVELDDVLHSFRSVFHSPHWTGSAWSAQSHLSLRYRSSVEQMLSILQMTAESLAEGLIGRRACLTTLGDVNSPRAQRACGVILVHVQASVVDTPILVDSLGQGVANQLLSELWNPPLQTPWCESITGEDNYYRIRALLESISVKAYCGDLQDERFQKCLCDFIEMRILGVSWETWARSFLLRSTLVIAAVEPANPNLPPEQNPEVIATHILRTALARVAELLANWQSDLFQESRSECYRTYLRLMQEVRKQLRAVHGFLRDNCIVPDVRGMDWLAENDVRWQRHVELQLRNCPWLRNPEVAGLSCQLFKAVRDRCDSALTVDQRHPDSVAALWPEIRRELARLRDTYLEITSQSLYYQSSLPEAKRLKPAIEKDDRRFSRYVTKLLPLSSARDQANYRSVKSLISPRGHLLAADEPGQTRLTEAIAEFYSRLLGLLPTWRRRCASRILTIHPAVDRPAMSEPDQTHPLRGREREQDSQT